MNTGTQSRRLFRVENYSGVVTVCSLTVPQLLGIIGIISIADYNEQQLNRWHSTGFRPIGLAVIVI